ncbi:MAG: hypothetical protein WCO69_01305 [Candidatus Omnitrophota bacterium]
MRKQFWPITNLLKLGIGMMAFAGILCFIVPSAFAQEKPFASTAAGKASIELIKSFTNFVKDVTAMNGMTDQEKVNYILTKGKERINEVRAKRLKDTVKAKALDYVKARMRADLFKAQVPAMLNAAIVEGKSVSSVWSAADVEIKSKLDTQMNAVKSAVSAAEIGWKVYGAWSTKGAEEGARVLGTEVGTKIIEYFIPGWGYYRLAQAATEAIGNYVVQYAFDTSLDEKMKVVLTGHDPRSNPKEFGDWIMGLDIAAYVQREWDEQLAYGGWYLKGSNEGESMKSSIIKALEKMKAEVKQRSDTQNQLQTNLQTLDDEARAAASAVQSTIDASAKEFEPITSEIDKFQSDIINAQKQDYEEKVQEREDFAAMEKQHFDRFQTAFKYSPFDHGTVLEAMRNGLSEITEGFGSKGYDQKALEQGFADYLQTRQKVLGAKNDEVEGYIKQAQDICAKANAQFGPILQSLWKQRDDYWFNDARRAALDAQIASVSEAYRQMDGPYVNIAMRNFLPEQFALDQEILAGEEYMVYLEVKEREVKFRQAMGKLAEELQNATDQAVNDYNASMAALGDKGAKLHYPGAMSAPTETFAALVQEIKNAQFFFYQPGDVIKTAEYFETIKSNLLADKEAMPSFQAELRTNFNAYAAATGSVVAKFQSSVPKAIQVDNAGQNYYEHVLTNADPYPEPISRTMLIEDYGIAGKRTYAMIPRVWGYDKNQVEYDAYLKALPGNTASAFSEVLAATEKLLSELGPKKDSDAVALVFERIMGVINQDMVMMNVGQFTLEQEKARQSQMFTLPDYAGFMQLEPDKMKGAEYLVSLKSAWDKNKDLVKILNNLKKGIARDVVYYTKFQEAAFPALDIFNTVPDRIALYEATLATVKKAYADRMALGFKYLDDAKKKLDELNKETWVDQKIKGLKDFSQGTVKTYLSLYSSYAKTEETTKLVSQWTEFNSKVQDAIKKAEDDATAAKAKLDAEWAAQQQKQRDAEAAAQQAQVTAQIKSTMTYISVVDPRLNSRAMNGVSSTVQVDRGGLVSGVLQLTGRLSFMNNVERMLISVDDGRTWDQLPLTQMISHSFTPIAGVVYVPQIKVRLTTGDEGVIKFFPNVQGIVYQDIDFNQMVLDAVKLVADTYERADAGAFSDLISREYLGNKTMLEEGVRFDFDMFTSIKIVIYVSRIERRGDQMVVETRWDKTQTPRKTGQDQRTSGNTVMVFKLEDGRMKIYNLRGNLLYATMSPEIAQASGLSAATVALIRTAQADRNPTQPGAGSTTDAGGVTTTNSDPTPSSSGLPLKTGQIMDVAGAGIFENYDFSANAEVGVGSGDIGQQDAEFQKVGTAGIKFAAGSFDATTDASGVGGGDFSIPNVSIGDVYIFITTEGYYGKMEITGKTVINGGLGVVTTYTFKYALQTDSTTNVATN